MATSKVYDISPLISERIAVFPGDTPFRNQRLLSFEKGHHFELSHMHSTVHLGAHADAPIHYHRDGVGIAERDPMLYVGQAQVITAMVARGTRILPKHLAGQRVTASRVLIRTSTFPNPEKWNSDFAALSPELIDWLADRGVKLVGIDTPSIDLEADKALESHQAVYRRNLAVLEGLVLEGVEDGLYTLIAQPLRIECADASPVRALLLQDSGVYSAFGKWEPQGDV